MTVFGVGTFWVILTNILLGIATLTILFFVGSVVLQEVVRRARSMRAAKRHDRAVLRRLGITLPDGGEPIDEMEELRKQERGTRKEETGG